MARRPQVLGILRWRRQLSVSSGVKNQHGTPQTASCASESEGRGTSADLHDPQTDWLDPARATCLMRRASHTSGLGEPRARLGGSGTYTRRLPGGAGAVVTGVTAQPSASLRRAWTATSRHGGGAAPPGHRGTDCDELPPISIHDRRRVAWMACSSSDYPTRVSRSMGSSSDEEPPPNPAMMAMAPP